MWFKDQLTIDPIFANHLSKKDMFSHVFQLQGEVFRQHKNRKTFRYIINNESYFIKLHRPVGWLELFKNLFKGSIPVLTAVRERQALARLAKLSIPVPSVVGFGCRGMNPACLYSFIITKELVNTQSLEEFCINWRTSPPAFNTKLALIHEVARIARVMHANNMNHRDFYICHFLLEKSNNKQDLLHPKLYLIDLHRAQYHWHLSKRWIVNDLSRLYFSILNYGLTQRDIFRFIRHYSKKPLREQLLSNAFMWKKINAHALRLYKKVYGQKKEMHS